MQLRAFFRPTISLWGLCHCAGALAGVCTLTGFAGRFGWLFDLTSHFRVQYGGGLALLAILCLAWKKFRPAAAYGSLALANLAVVASCLRSVPDHPAPGGRSMRVALVNVHTANERFDLVRQFILNSQPDVIVLEEVDDRWLTELAGLRASLPHQLNAPRDDNFGVALFSRWPLHESRVVCLGEADVPSIAARVAVGARLVTVLATHPLPPSSPRYAGLRDEQLVAVSEFVADRDGPAILLGDLNATPWSHAFRRLLRESGLQDSSRGRGLHATWPAQLWLLRIPIDHCLVSSGVQVVSKHLGPQVGSDHLPLVVELRP
jgi:endonuclease/exonuclease/phosphatase (EEP) superfamily protein YafD